MDIDIQNDTQNTQKKKGKEKKKKAMPVQQRRSMAGNNNDENPRYNQVKQRIRHGHGVTVALTDTIPRKKARICWNNITNELLSVVTKFQIRRFGNARRKTRSELWTNTQRRIPNERQNKIQKITRKIKKNEWK